VRWQHRDERLEEGWVAEKIERMRRKRVCFYF